MNKKMTEEQKRLVTDNYNLIYSVLKNIHIGGLYFLDREDLSQAALEAMCNAAIQFDSEKGCSFSSYAYIYIRNRIFNMFRDLNAGNGGNPENEIRFNADFTVSLTGAEDQCICLEDPDNTYASIEFATDLESELHRMECKSEKEKKSAFITRRLLEGMPVLEICRWSEISPPTYYRLLNAARAVLRENLLSA